MPSAKPAKTYQQMTDQLNELVQWFEGDQVNLDEAVEKYQQATELLAQMQDYLKTTQNKVKKITEKFSHE